MPENSRVSKQRGPGASKPGQAASQTGSARAVQRNGNHVQLFIYRIPKKNHDAMLAVETQLTGIYREHGALTSHLFMLSEPTAFEGFTSVDRAVSAKPDEEVWVEVDEYEDDESRKSSVARIGKDPEAGPLFGQLMELVAGGYSVVMGEFDRLGP